MKRKYEIAVLSKGAFARSVRIYAPKKADRAVIMHDGQNVFYDGDASYKKSWRALDLLKERGIKNTAVIGIDSAPTRNFDYVPFPSELEGHGLPPFGGNAEAYAVYLEDIVIPYLDRRFGFKTYAMLGSSFGALFSLYFAARQNPRVTAYGLFSAPLFVCPEAFGKFFSERAFRATDAFTVYAGGSEDTQRKYSDRESQLFVDDAFTLTNALRRAGVTDIELTMTNTAVHDETAWRAPAAKFLERFAKTPLN